MLFATTAVPTSFAADESASLQSAYLRGEYNQVLSRTRQLLKGSDPSSREEILYLQGVSALKLRELELARQSLNQYLTDYPNGRWAPNAWMALGESFALAGENEQALTAYQKLLSLGQNQPFKPQALLRLGQVQWSLGSWEESKASLQGVIQQFPNSAEAAQAKELLQGGDFYFSVQVGAFSSQSNAMKLKTELERRGYETQIVEAQMQGKRFFRVRVGQFSSRQDAQQQAQRLKNEGFPGKVAP